MFAIGRAICIAVSIAFLFVLTQPEEDALAENVICDPTVDTSAYYCRGWQDGVGKYGSRVQFIARMIGEDEGDDFGAEIATLGDINGDARDDFMVWAKNKCEWRVYLGDSLITRTPHMIWPRCSPGHPGHFAMMGDISGDEHPDLLREVPATPRRIEIYFAGPAFDTLPDLIIRDSAFIFPGGAGKNMGAGLDLNGDNQPDFVLGDPSYLKESPKENGRAYVFWGGSALDTIPDLILSDTFWTGQNQPVAVGGAISLIPSVNGDPYAELILGRRSQNYLKDPPGRVDVFFGGPDMDTVRDLYFESADTGYSPYCYYYPSTGFGGIAENLGDVNQDGFEDLLVTGPGCTPAYIYYGGTGFDTLVDLRLTHPWPSPQGEGSAATVLGDINGDGHRDFCIVRPGDDISGGWVYIHFADPSPVGSADWIIAGDDWFLTARNFGRATTSLGDVNGDGFDDFAVGTETSYVDENNRGEIYIFAGYDPDINSGVFDDPEAPVPTSHRLVDQIAPNPFNAGTTIRLSDGFASGSIAIYNILGREIIDFEVTPNGTRSEVFWDGRDRHGRTLASGLYFARAIAGVQSETHKLVLLK